MISGLTNYLPISETNKERLVTTGKVLSLAATITALVATTFRACAFARNCINNPALGPYLGYAFPVGIASGLVVSSLLNTLLATLNFSFKFKEVFNGKDHKEFNEVMKYIFASTIASMVAGCSLTVSVTFLYNRGIIIV